VLLKCSRPIQGKLPRAKLSYESVKALLFACVTTLGTASCPPEHKAQEEADELIKCHLTADRKDGATAYAEPQLFPNIRTNGVAFLTNWRPYLHGLVKAPCQTVVPTAATTGLRFACLSSYMAPGRMSYTGSLLGGRIIEAFGGQVINPLCLDLLFLYLIAAGDNVKGTGSTAPDYKLNAQVLIECANLVFPVLFFNPARVILCIDSDMCKYAMFAWFARLRRRLCSRLPPSRTSRSPSSPASRAPTSCTPRPSESGLY